MAVATVIAYRVFVPGLEKAQLCPHPPKVAAVAHEHAGCKLQYVEILEGKVSFAYPGSPVPVNGDAAKVCEDLKTKAARQQQAERVLNCSPQGKQIVKQGFLSGRSLKRR